MEGVNLCHSPGTAKGTPTVSRRQGKNIHPSSKAAKESGRLQCHFLRNPQKKRPGIGERDKAQGSKQRRGVCEGGVAWEGLGGGKVRGLI